MQKTHDIVILTYSLGAGMISKKLTISMIQEKFISFSHSYSLVFRIAVHVFEKFRIHMRKNSEYSNQGDDYKHWHSNGYLNLILQRTALALGFVRHL